MTLAIHTRDDLTPMQRAKQWRLPPDQLRVAVLILAERSGPQSMAARVAERMKAGAK